MPGAFPGFYIGDSDMIMYTPSFILIAAAVIPAVILLIQVYRADKLEKEPVNLLVQLVFLGILSTMFALVLETVGTALFENLAVHKGMLYYFLFYLIVVGCSEEGGKYLLLKLKTWKHPAFNCQFDGVVYAVFVSLGFALWENISYVASYGLQVALLRAFTAVPGHACFGVFMGVFYGIAKRADNYGEKVKASVFRKLAFFVPVLIHGLYDFFATCSEFDGIFLGFILVMFFICSRFVKGMSRHDKSIVNDDADFHFYIDD